MVQYASQTRMESTYFKVWQGQNYKLLGHFEMIGESTLFYLVIVGLLRGSNPKWEKSCGIDVGSFILDRIIPNYLSDTKNTVITEKERKESKLFFYREWLRHIPLHWDSSFWDHK